MEYSLKMTLVDGMDAFGFSYDDPVVSRLLDFLELLEKWNKIYNLTGITNPERMVSMHLLDSLAVLPYLHGQRIIDIGTGAGLPGIPLAIMSPEKSFFLLDSNSKKTRFVQQVVLELDITNARIIHSRAEEFKIQQKFDTIVVRAFATVLDILDSTRHLLSKDGKVLALKGKFPGEEISGLSKNECTVIPLRVPGIDAERHLVYLSPSTGIELLNQK